MNRLIYDRTIDDVNYARENQDDTAFLKGAYNYTDLNRIEEWAQYLSTALTSNSYIINYAPHENQNNIITHGSLCNNTNGWTMNTDYDYSSNNEFTTIKEKTSGTGTRACYQSFEKITGKTESTKQMIYACAKVRGRSANTSYPRVYLRYYANDSITASFSNLSSIDGKSGTQLNDNKWHTLSARFTTYSNNNYFDFDRISFGIAVSTPNDEMDIKYVYLINLTEMFGRGYEPSKAWCDTYLSEIWSMAEFPTYNEMERIRQNIRKIMVAFTFKTKISSTVNNFDYKKANNWEKILWEISTFLVSMENYKVYCGVANSGQERFWQHRFRIKSQDNVRTWDDIGYTYWNEIPSGNTWQDVVL